MSTKKEKTTKRKSFYDFTVNKKIREYLDEQSKKSSNKQAVADFATAVGVSKENVRQWRNGYSRPDIDKLIIISNILGCSLEYLLGASECKNLENININEELGLSNEAINNLKELQKKDIKTTLIGNYKRNFANIDIINYFLSQEEFWDVCRKQAKNILAYYTNSEYKKQFDKLSESSDISPFDFSNVIVNSFFYSLFKDYVIKSIVEYEPELKKYFKNNSKT